MFASPVLDAALGLDGPLIVHVDVLAHPRIGVSRLFLRIEPVLVFAVLPRSVIRQRVQLQPLRAHRRPVHRTIETGKDRIPVAAHVIDGHVPLRNRHSAREGNHNPMRKDHVGYADMHRLRVQLPERGNPQAVLRPLHLDARARKFPQQPRHRDIRPHRHIAKLPPIGAGGIVILEKSMQKTRMCRIDPDLQRLQPVAVDQTLEGEGVLVRCCKTIKRRKRRRLAFAQIRPDDPATLHARIRALTHLAIIRAPLRLRRLLQARTRRIEQPAMKRTAQPAILAATHRQVRPTMCAMPVHQPDAPRLIAKQHQILTQQTNPPHRPRPIQLIHQRRRLPIPAHEPTPRRPPARPRHLRVVIRCQHGGIVPEARK